MGNPVSAVIANLYMKIFEEQAIESAPCRPKIWKRYVDDTFTTLDRDKVDDILQHLNSQQPSIRLITETESNSKIAFLNTSVCWEPDRRLTSSVHRMPTHTDQYLAYYSHHPQSVKCSIVKCLYDQAKRLVSKPSVISEEKKHLSSVLVSNGYPSSFVKKITKTRTAPRREPVAEVKSTTILPYIQGVSEPLYSCLEQQGISLVFKSHATLRSHLVQKKPSIRLNKMAWSTGFPAMRESLYRGNREIYAGKDQRAQQGYTTRPYPDLCRFRTRPRDRPLSNLERS